MGNTNQAPVEAAQINAPQVQQSFETVKKCVVLYGVISAIVLGTVAVVAAMGQSPTAFMWVRSALLLAVSVVIHRIVISASQGSRRAYDRLATLTVILPIAIIAVDLIPGLCPAWYAVMQGVSALALIGAACVTKGAGLRAVFAKAA